jgi:hypothetical protein
MYYVQEDKLLVGVEKEVEEEEDEKVTIPRIYISFQRCDIERESRGISALVSCKLCQLSEQRSKNWFFLAIYPLFWFQFSGTIKLLGTINGRCSVLSETSLTKKKSY